MSHRVACLAALAFVLASNGDAPAHGQGSAAHQLSASPLIPPRPRGATYHVTVSAAASSAVNAIDPLRSLGAGVDSQTNGAVSKIYTSPNVEEMLSSGLGPVTYRLYTELSVQDWHWNPVGTWSQAGQQGYFIGTTSGTPYVTNSYGYALPHRGFTHDQGNDNSYSRLDDGDPATYWKSDPYLDTRYTGDSNALHPQWAVFDLGAKKDVDAVNIAWAAPYATSYAVQYWTGDDAIGDPANGNWQTFPSGSITSGAGGAVTLQVSASPIKAEFIRFLLTASSNTCDSHGSSDPRDCVGYAIDEIGIGTIDSRGFHDLVVHSPNKKQTVTYASSVDSWHASTDRVRNQEQPGLDIVFRSGVTRSMPAMIPVSMLYGTPDDAAAEIRYVEGRGYPISYVELGEEPDGQYIVPEDYAALFVQWASALHAVDGSLKLGGPVFQGTTSDVPAWPNAAGNTSWFQRFLAYLSQHGALNDLAFMSFEYYPFGPCPSAGSLQNDLVADPTLIQRVVNTWYADGLSKSVPLFITESNISANDTPVFQEIGGALWYADYVGAFLANGGQGAYLYEYEPDPLEPYGPCGWGSWGMFNASPQYTVRQTTSQYFAAQLVTQQWAQPVDQMEAIYPAATDVLSGKRELVTAYAIDRPDGTWALMLVNKDASHPYRVVVNFKLGSGTMHFASPVAATTFGAAQYKWHPDGKNGSARPDGPAVTSSLSGGASAVYTVPAASITVLRSKLGK
jgi:hypothetical protein